MKEGGLFISEGRQPTQVFASMRLQDDALGADQGRQIGRAFECVQFVVGYSGHKRCFLKNASSLKLKNKYIMY